MAKTLKILIPFIILMILITCAYAYDDSKYTNICGDTKDCNAERTRLGQSDTYSVYSKPISNIQGTPLIDDLDNDNFDEIIVYGDSELKAYRHKNLTYVNSILGYTPTSNVLILDIDDDNYDEIIFHNWTRRITIFNFSDGEFHLERDIPLYYSLSQIACDDASNQCMGVGTQESGGTVRHAFIGFNYTNSTGYKYSSSTSASAGYCEPSVISPYAGDVDENDGGKPEFIFSRISVSGGDIHSSLIVFSFERNSSCDEGGCTPVQNWVSGADMGDFLPADAGTPFISCSHVNDAFSDNAGMANTWGTSPLVYEFADSSGKEIVVCYRYNTVGANRCSTIKSNGAVFDSHPTVLGLTDTFGGEFLSNVFLADVFDGPNGKDEYCVIGYAASSTTVAEVFCASERDTYLLQESIKFYARDENEYRDYNVTGNNPEINYQTHNALLAHSIDAGAGLDFNGQDQVIGAYGIFVLDLQSALSEYYTLIDFSAESTINMSLVPVKYGNSTYNQVIAVSENNLFFIWDQYEKSGAYFNYTVDPCKNGGIKNGTSVIVKMTVFDDDAGTIFPNVEYMYNNVNQQVINFTAGAVNNQIVDFTFSANATSPNVIIRMCANSTSRPDVMNCLAYTTSVVAGTGNEQGDCVDSGGAVEIPTTPAGGVTTTTLSSVPAFFGEVGSITGMAAWVWWFILMVMLNVAIVIYIRMDAQIIFILLGIFNVFMFVLGAYFGFISITVIVIMAVIGAFMIGIPILLWLLAHGGGGGGSKPLEGPSGKG